MVGDVYCLAMLLFHSREGIYADVVVRLTRIEADRWESLNVWRVGEMLSLETESGAVLIVYATLAELSAINKVASIELDARLCCVDSHYTTALRISHLSRNAETIVTDLTGDDEVMVVTVAELNLRMLTFEAVANGMGSAEVEGRSIDRHKLAGGDETAVDRGNSVSPNADALVVNSGVALTCKVEE